VREKERKGKEGERRGGGSEGDYDGERGIEYV